MLGERRKQRPLRAQTYLECYSPALAPLECRIPLLSLERREDGAEERPCGFCGHGEDVYDEAGDDDSDISSDEAAVGL